MDLGSRTSRRDCMPVVRQAVTESMEKTVWQVIHCWNHWYLPEEQQMIFCLAQKQNSRCTQVDIRQYEDREQILSEYHAAVRNEIERVKNSHE